MDGSDVCTDAWTAAYSTYGHCKLRINSICRRYCRRYPFALRGTIWRDYPVFDGWSSPGWAKVFCAKMDGAKSDWGSTVLDINSVNLNMTGHTPVNTKTAWCKMTV